MRGGTDGYLLQAAHRHVLYAACRDGHRARGERPRRLCRAQRDVRGGSGAHRKVVQRRADRDAVRRNVDRVCRHRHLKKRVCTVSVVSMETFCPEITTNMHVLTLLCLQIVVGRFFKTLIFLFALYPTLVV